MRLLCFKFRRSGCKNRKWSEEDCEGQRMVAAFTNAHPKENHLHIALRDSNSRFISNLSFFSSSLFISFICSKNNLNYMPSLILDPIQTKDNSIKTDLARLVSTKLHWVAILTPPSIIFDLGSVYFHFHSGGCSRSQIHDGHFKAFDRVTTFVWSLSHLNP